MAGKDKREVVHSAPTKTLVDRVIELALGAGGGAVTLLSGLLAAVLILYSGYVLYDTFATERAASSSAWDLVQFKPEIMDDYEIPLSSSDLEDINKEIEEIQKAMDSGAASYVLQYSVKCRQNLFRTIEE